MPRTEQSAASRVLAYFRGASLEEAKLVFDLVKEALKERLAKSEKGKAAQRKPLPAAPVPPAAPVAAQGKAKAGKKKVAKAKVAKGRKPRAAKAQQSATELADVLGEPSNVSEFQDSPVAPPADSI